MAIIVKAALKFHEEKLYFEASTCHKKFRNLHGTRRFVVILTAAKYRILCSARLHQHTHTHTHTLPSNFIKICFPIFSTSTPKSFEKSLSFTSTVQNLYAHLSSHSCYITCSSSPSSFKDTISILWRLSIMNPCIMIFPSRLPLPDSRTKYSSQHPVL